MTKAWSIAASLMLGAAALGTYAMACPGNGTHETAGDPKQVTLSELDTLLKAEQVSVFDANGASTRAKYGIIPGAVLLTSSSAYSLDQLPAAKDRKLVFYCANTMCTASHTAARRAVEAGYADVGVLPDGIMGWKQAGKPTQGVPQS